MCAHGGGQVTLDLDVLIRVMKANVLGRTLLVTGSHVIRSLANEMSVRAL